MDRNSYIKEEFEVRSLAAGAGLRPVGVFFPNINAEDRARRAYRSNGTAKTTETPVSALNEMANAESSESALADLPGTADARQADLARWHALEEAQPELFGRMHVLFAQRRLG